MKNISNLMLKILLKSIILPVFCGNTVINIKILDLEYTLKIKV